MSNTPHIICKGETLTVVDKHGKEIDMPMTPTHIRLEDGKTKGVVRLVVHYETKPVRKADRANPF